MVEMANSTLKTTSVRDTSADRRSAPTGTTPRGLAPASADVAGRTRMSRRTVGLGMSLLAFLLLFGLASQAAAQTNVHVEINSKTFDPARLGLVRVSVAGTSLVLTYSRPLDAISTPANGDYTIGVDTGTTPTVSNVAIDRTVVTLTLDPAVTGDQTVTLSYAPGTNRVQDSDGTQAVALTDLSVPNTLMPSLTAPFNQGYLLGEAITPLTLPAASNFAGTLTYTLLIGSNRNYPDPNHDPFDPSSPPRYPPHPNDGDPVDAVFTGLTFDPASRVLSGTPTRETFPPVTLNYAVTDGTVILTESFGLTIYDETDPGPRFLHFPEQFQYPNNVLRLYYEVGQSIDPRPLPEALDPAGGVDSLNYELMQEEALSLADLGFSFDPVTLVLSGTPTLAGAVFNGALGRRDLSDPDGGTVTTEYAGDGIYPRGHDNFRFRYLATDASGTSVELFIDLDICESGAMSDGNTVCEAPVPMIMDFPSGLPVSETFPVNVEITPLELPAATGGTGSDPRRVYELSPLPAGLAFNTETRILTGTPTKTRLTAVLTYSAQDTASSQRITTSMVSMEVTGGPRLTSVQSNLIFTRDTAITTTTLPLAMSAGGTSSLTYTLTGPDSLALITAVPGLTFASDTRALTGTPTILGRTELTYTVVDNAGAPATDVQTFDITVGGGTLSPDTGHQTYTVGSMIPNLTFPELTDAAGPIRHVLTRVNRAPLSSALPGLVFDPVTRVLSGTPSRVTPDDEICVLSGKPATFNSDTGARTRSTETPNIRGATGVTYSAFYNGGEVYQSFCVTVDGLTLPEPTGGRPFYVVDVPIEPLTLPEATDGTGTITYTLVGDTRTEPDNSLPVGLTFNAAERTLTGTPTETGNTVLVYTATDSATPPVSTTRRFSFPVNTVSFGDGPLLPAIPSRAYLWGSEISTELPRSPARNPLRENGNTLLGPVSYTLTGPNGQALSEAVPGLTFDPRISSLTGTPTEYVKTTLTYTATADNDLSNTVRTFTITVSTRYEHIAVDLDQSYLVDMAIPDTPLPDTPLPPGEVGVTPYTYTLNEAFVAVPGSTVSATVEEVVPGLTFDTRTLILSGTPTVPGTRTLTYTITDSDTPPTVRTFNIEFQVEEVLRSPGNQTFPISTLIPDRPLPRASALVLGIAAPDNTFPVVNPAIPVVYTLTGPSGQALSAAVPGLNFDPATRILSGTTPATVGTTPLTYTVTNSDTSTTVGTATFDLILFDPTLEVEVLMLQPVGDQLFQIDMPIPDLTLPADDRTTNPVTYTLTGPNDAVTQVPGLAFDPDTRILSGTPTAMGDTVLTYTVSASRANTVSETFTFTVTVNDLPRLPTFPAIERFTYPVDVSITDVELPAVTGTGRSVIYSLEGEVPGLNFDPDTRILSGTPTTTGVYDELTYTVVTDDGVDSVTVMFVIFVTGLALESPGDQEFNLGQAVSLTLPTVTGLGGTIDDTNTVTINTVTYAVGGDNLPDGLTFTEEILTLRGRDGGAFVPQVRVGILSGTPTTAGSAMLTYIATEANADGEVGSVGVPFNLDIAGLALQSPGNQRWTVGDTVTSSPDVPPVDTVRLFLPEATGFVGTPTYTLTGPSNQALSDAVPGLTFAVGNRVTGVNMECCVLILAGIPTTAGGATLTYMVTDDTPGASAMATFTVTIDIDAEANRFLTAPPNQRYVRGILIGSNALTLPEVVNPDGTPTYTLTGSGGEALSTVLPGMSFDATARTLSGRPARLGRIVLLYTANDDSTTGSVTFFVDVFGDTVLSQPILTAPANQRYAINQEITSLTLPAAFGFTGTPTYTLTGPSGAFLPVGLVFAPSDRILSGRPTTAGLTTLTYSVTAESSDRPGTATFDVEVLTSGTLILATPMDQRYEIDESVNLVLPTVTDSTGPVTYTLTRVPDGLMFDSPSRVLSGTFMPMDDRDGNPRPGSVRSRLAYTATDTNGFVTVNFDIVFAAADAPMAISPDDQTYPALSEIPALTLEPSPSDLGLTLGPGLPDPERTVYIYSLTGPGGVPLRYAVPGLWFDPGRRILSGTPIMGAAAVTLTYTVADGVIDSVITSTATFDVTITQLRLPFTGFQTYTINQAITSATLPEALDVTGTATYTLTSGFNSQTGPERAALPAGLNFNAATRILSGTPTVLGTTRLVYMVTDGSVVAGDDPTIAIFDVIVAAVGEVPQPPTSRTDTDLRLSVQSNQIYIANEEIAPFALREARNVTGTPIYTLTGSDGAPLPAGLAFNPATRILSGTPTAVDVTTLIYTVTDATATPTTASQTFSVIVTDAPVVDDIKILKNGPYALNEAIVVDVTFSETVTVNTDGGFPQISLIVGESTRQAVWESGNGTNRLFFSYTVVPGDRDDDGVTIGANVLNLNGGTIQGADGDDALLLHPAVARNRAADVVDTVAPVLVGASVINGKRMVLTYNEPLGRGIRGFDVRVDPDDDESLPLSAAIPAPGDYVIGVTTGTPPTVSNVAVNGAEVTLTLTAAITGAPTVTVSYTRGTNQLRDLAGNQAAALSNMAVTTISTVLTLPYLSDRFYEPTRRNNCPPEGDPSVSGTCTEYQMIAPLTLPEATGVTGTPSYALTGTLPDGLTYTTATRILSGRANTPGVTTLTYTVTAGNGAVSRTFDVTIAELPPMLQLPVPYNQRYGINQAITPVTLPEAENVTGTPTYTLTSGFDTETGPERAALPAALNFDPATRILSGTPTVLGTYTLVYTVTDDNGAVDSTFGVVDNAVDSTFEVVVAVAVGGGGGGTGELQLNPPFSERTYVVNERIRSGLPPATGFTGIPVYTLTGPGGADLPAGLTFAQNTEFRLDGRLLDISILSGMPELGTYTLVYTVTADNGSATTSFTINVVDRLLRLPSPTNQRYIPGQAITPFTLQAARDATGTPIYTLTGSGGMSLGDAVPGLVFDPASRVLSGTPFAEGVTTLIYRVTDGGSGGSGDTVSGSFEVVINGLRLPRLVDQFYTAQEFFNLTLPQALGFTGTPTYTLTGLPGGLNFDPDSRVLSGSRGNFGENPVTYRVNADNGAASGTFIINIVQSGTPRLPTMFAQDYRVGQEIIPFTLPRATGFSGTNDIYFLDGSLPDGLTFTRATRVLSGTPTTEGFARLVYRVNANQRVAEVNFDIRITGLRLSDPSNQFYLANQAITFALPRATGFTGTPIYTLAGSLPAGLNFDADTSILSGTPTTVSVNTLVYTVTDGATPPATVSQTFVVTVTESPLVNSVAITSAGPYALGENIEVTVTFSETVEVVGTPQITLVVGRNTRRADYTRGSGSTGLVFAYTVLAEDMDEDGVSIFPNALTVTGGASIQDIDRNDAFLLHPTVTAKAAHIVDTVALVLEGASVNNGNRMVLTYNKQLSAGIRGFNPRVDPDDPDSLPLPARIPAPGDYMIVVTPCSAETVSNADADSCMSPTVSAVSLNGAEVTLTLTAAIIGAPTVTLTYTPGTNPLRDVAGNEAAALSNVAVTTISTVLTLPYLSDRFYEPTRLNNCPPEGDPSVSGTCTEYQMIAPLTLPEATGVTGTPSYTLTGNLPDGLTYATDTRILSGRANTPGVTTLIYTVTADNGAVSRTFDVTIAELPPMLQLPVPSNQRYVRNQTITPFTLQEAENVTGTPTYTLTLGFDPQTGPDRAALPTALNFNADTRILSGTPTALGTFTLVYTVTDDNGAVDSTFDVTVAATAELRLSPPFLEGTYVLDSFIHLRMPEATGVTGTPTYTLTGPGGAALPPGLNFGANTVIRQAGRLLSVDVLSGTPRVVGATTLTYTVTDDNGSDTTSFVINVVENLLRLRVPIRLGYAVGEPFAYTLDEAIDVTGTPTYTLTGQERAALPAGLNFERSTRILSGTPTAIGNTMLTYMVTDVTESSAETVSGSFMVSSTLLGLPVDLPDQRYTLDREFDLTLPAATGFTGRVTYSLIGPSGPARMDGLTFDPTSRVLSGTPTIEDAIELTYRATDDVTNLDRIFTLEIVGGGLSLPVVDSERYAVNQEFSLTLLAATGFTGTPTYTLTGPAGASLPARLAFDPTSRVLSGTPTTLGDTLLTYTVTDSVSTAEQTFTLTIVLGLSLPVVDSEPYVVNQTFSLTLPEAEIVTGTPIYTLTGPAGASLPDGLNFDPTTRVLSGTPTMLGDTQLTYTVTDSVSTAEQTFTLTIVVLSLPALVDERYAVNQAFSLTLPEAENVTGSAIYTLTGPAGASLPDGLNFDPTTRILFGTPALLGETMLTYTATDSVVIVEETFALVIFDVDLVLPEQRYTLNREFALTLPVPTTGLRPGVAMLTYTLTGPGGTALPAGLTFNPATRILSGTLTSTPTARALVSGSSLSTRILSGTQTQVPTQTQTAMGNTMTLEYTVTDRGIVIHRQDLIFRNVQEGGSLNAINEIILPEIARAMTDNTVNAITQRVERAAAGPAVTTMTLDGKTVSLTALAKSDTLAGALDDQSTGVAALLSGIARTATNKSWRLDRALGNSSFVMPLTSQDMISRLTLWGGGDYRNLSGETNTLDWDGDIFSYRVGADAQVSDRVLAGVAVSWQSGEFDYADNTTSTTGRGAYEVEQTSVHPYLGWTAADGRLSLWATLGYGFGDVVLDDPDIDTQTSDLITRSVAVGGSGDLLQAGATTLRIKGQLQHTQVEVEGNTDLLRELTLDARRIRVALEGTHEYQFANGARLAPTVEVGLRQDGGDGRVGSGAEVGGGLRFTDTVHGLTVESRGRVLLAHSGNYKDWGVGGTIRFAPGQAGRGMAFSLVPSYGATASRVASLWAQELAVSPTANAASPTPRNGKMDVDLSYGLAWAGADALITPYSRLSLTNTDTHAYRVGSRLQMQDGLAFNLEALRREAATKPVEHGILLKLQLDW